ncbi:DUF2563 family protein [Kibdelosporangium philippinense]|uniref:DUF2563 family protein n=1 Tax=Kibdelosporangium philippinense TaxID=211113 RepID=A0ABS8Z0X1_9PSEU|nr:DUF2563 family protein [Kibdelosporangium philippinense]MCE7001604.1 DUF2563 family protein [Kibdelosporangium philippinense]
MKYDTGELRNGARRSRQSGDSAEEVSNKLRGASVSASPFGDVPIASSFAGALSQAQQDQAKGARSAGQGRDNKAARADSVANAGDDLTVTTTQVANQAVVNDIADRM